MKKEKIHFLWEFWKMSQSIKNTVNCLYNWENWFEKKQFYWRWLCKRLRTKIYKWKMAIMSEFLASFYYLINWKYSIRCRSNEFLPQTSQPTAVKKSTNKILVHYNEILSRLNIYIIVLNDHIYVNAYVSILLDDLLWLFEWKHCSHTHSLN